MKRGRRVKLRFLPVCPSGGAALYFILILFSYILAQAMRSAFFHAVLRFCLCLPILSILCLVIAQFFLRGYAEKSCFYVQRLEEGKYSLIISNRGILPISCIRVSLTAPVCNGEGEAAFVTESAPLQPLSTLRFEFSARYDRRGVFKIGSDAVYLYDLMHLIRIKKKINGISTVSVLPRMLEGSVSVRDGGSGEELFVSSLDRSASYDYGDIREYRPGDAMKRIHWKLSSKSEELQVKRYSDLSEKSLCVICDRGAGDDVYGISAKDSLEAEDICIEESLSYVTEICSLGGGGCIIASSDDGRVLRRDFSGNGAEKEVRVWLTEFDKGNTAVPYELIPDDVPQVMYVLPFLSVEQVGRILDCQRATSAALTAHICDISNFIPEARRAEYNGELAKLTDSLAKNGVSFCLSKIGEVRDEA